MTQASDVPDTVIRTAHALRRGVTRRWMLIVLIMALPIAEALASGQSPPLVIPAVLLGLGAFANASIGQILTQPNVNRLTLHVSLATDIVLVAIFASAGAKVEWPGTTRVASG